MKKILPLAFLMLLAACGGDATKLIPTHYSALEGWGQDDHAAAFRVFADSCVANISRSNAYMSKAEGPVGVRHNWNRVCNMTEENPQPSDAAARAFFETNFSPYKVETESKETGLLTGYYEPILNGSLTRQGAFTTPVYGVPADLATRKPYYTREEIAGGLVKIPAPVLLYVDDPIMLFFLHIQGSGKVKLPDGTLVGLQYAAQNGHEFIPIGRVLKERGELPAPSMQGIRDWLREHPQERELVMNINPSYIFFKLSPGEQMAKGALGIPLTPLRSVAVDDDRAAYGVPTYIDTRISQYQTNEQIPLQRLFVSQDTGGALKGPHRGDLFFGRGEREEWQAGHQSAQGNVYWLLPVEEGVKLRDGVPLKPEELKEEKPEPVAPQSVPADEIPAQQAPAPVVQDGLTVDEPADSSATDVAPMGEDPNAFDEMPVQ